MLRILIRNSVFVLLLLIFLAISCTNTSKQTSAYGDDSPDFQLKDVNQETVILSSYIDKQPVLLFFWTTWCPYCRKELKIINSRYGELTKEGLELLPINVGESPERVNNFLKKDSLAFRVLLDQNGDAANSFGILGVPTYILIDKKGKILFQGHTFPEKEYKKLISR
jgi:peroxiredoxin